MCFTQSYDCGFCFDIHDIREALSLGFLLAFSEFFPQIHSCLPLLLPGFLSIKAFLFPSHPIPILIQSKLYPVCFFHFKAEPSPILCLLKPLLILFYVHIRWFGWFWSASSFLLTFFFRISSPTSFPFSPSPPSSPSSHPAPPIFSIWDFHMTIYPFIPQSQKL